VHLDIFLQYNIDNLVMAALYNRTGRYIFALWFPLLLLLLFFSPNLNGHRLDVYHTCTHGVAPSANSECRSEMCCMRLAGNARPKKSPKIRHLGTIAHICRAISLQLRHVSTIGKNLLNSNVSPTRPHNMVNFGPLAAEMC